MGQIKNIKLHIVTDIKRVECVNMCADKEIRESRRENNILKESFSNLVNLTSFKTKEYSSITDPSSTKPLKRKDNILERKLRRKKGKYSVLESTTVETIRKLDTDNGETGTKGKAKKKAEKGENEFSTSRDDEFTNVLRKEETVDDLHAATRSTSSLGDPSHFTDDLPVGHVFANRRNGIQCKLCKPSDM